MHSEHNYQEYSQDPLNILELHQEVFGDDNPAGESTRESKESDKFINFVSHNLDKIPTIESQGQFDIVMMATNDRDNDRNRDNERDKGDYKGRREYSNFGNNNQEYVQRMIEMRRNDPTGTKQYSYTLSSSEVQEIQNAGWDFGVLSHYKKFAPSFVQKVLMKELARTNDKQEQELIRAALDIANQELKADNHQRLLEEGMRNKTQKDSQKAPKTTSSDEFGTRPLTTKEIREQRQAREKIAREDRKSTRLNSSHRNTSRMPSSA